MIVTPPLIFLIFANLIPLVGVLYWGWQVYAIMLLFWLENIVVGLLNVVRIAGAAGDTGKKSQVHRRFGSGLFFSFHYGLFAFVHGAIIFDIFIEPVVPDIKYQLASIVMLVTENHIYWALLALLMSHVVSTMLNYFAAGEYKVATVKKLMHQPYQRVVILHVAVLGGGLLLQQFDEPLAGLAVLIIIKIAIDVIAHQKEHKDIMSHQTIFHRIFGRDKPSGN